MASGAVGCVVFAASMVGCFPRSDLSGYSIGASGSGGTGQDPEPQPDAGSTDSGAQTGSEGIDDMVPLAPQPDASSMLGSGMGSTVGPDAGEAACDGNGEFESSDGQSCYRIETQLAAWLAARDACRQWGGDLVKLETLAEEQFLLPRIENDVWIGVNDRETEGAYEWADGEPVSRFNWSEGQPDNFQGQENCAEIRQIDQLWNDRPCGGDPQGYVCER